jgi:DNA-binding FrmR family transcriptional regulator
MKNAKKEIKSCHGEHSVKNNVGGGDGVKIRDEQKGKVLRRLKLIEGQIRGLHQMIEKDTYCIDVITQTSAVKQGLSNVEDLLLEHHLGHCVLKQVAQGQTEKAKAEILKVYKLKRK